MTGPQRGMDYLAGCVHVLRCSHRRACQQQEQEATAPWLPKHDALRAGTRGLSTSQHELAQNDGQTLNSTSYCAQ